VRAGWIQNRLIPVEPFSNATIRPRLRRGSGYKIVQLRGDDVLRIPRTGALGHLRFVQACSRSGVASLSEGSAPTPRARAPFDRCAAPTDAQLRRPPADRWVKSATATKPGGERRLQRQTPSRSPRNLLGRALVWQSCIRSLACLQANARGGEPS